MPKGKKYTAAEKHFLEEKHKLLKKLRAAQERSKRCTELEAEVEVLTAQVEALENEKAELLKKLGMTPAEREREKKSVQCLEMLSAISKMGGYY